MSNPDEHASPRQILLKYEEERDVVFVFGAGASVADGALLQREVLPVIDRALSSGFLGSKSAQLVTEFIKSNFDLSDSSYPSLEAVFGYIDYFLTKKESLGGPYSTQAISSVRDTLVRLIHHVIDVHSKKHGTYRKFWKKVSSGNRNVSIITMNYDTMLDDAFGILYSREAFIDYCIEFMNYSKVCASTLPFVHWWWVNPRKVVTVWGDANPAPIKIIKIHGSLNWKFCNCCNRVLLTPWQTDIDVPSDGFKGRISPNVENLDGAEFDLVCPFDGTRFDTFIVPPSHIKQLNHPAINNLLDEGAIEVRAAKHLVFVGYSFPQADVHIKALFKKNLRSRIPITVVDPFLNPEIERNYRCLGEGVRFFRSPFEEFIDSDLESILARN